MTEAELLLAAFAYDPATGLFKRTGKFGNRSSKGWFASSLSPTGYRMIGHGKKVYYAHRLAVLCMTGDWPTEQVDHVNCDKADNRWANLRLATYNDNQANVRSKRTGLKGAYSMGARWKAAIRRDGRQHHLGCFGSEQEAHEAYIRAAATLHGEFARAS